MSGYDAGVGGAAIGQGGVPAWQPPAIDLRCDTCGATFAAQRALAAHLVDAYHGFQCLHCGALFARRRHFDEHTCQGPDLLRRRAYARRLRVQVSHLMPAALFGVLNQSQGETRGVDTGQQRRSRRGFGLVARETGGDKEAVVEERLHIHTAEIGAP